MNSTRKTGLRDLYVSPARLSIEQILSLEPRAPLSLRRPVRLARRAYEARFDPRLEPFARVWLFLARTSIYGAGMAERVLRRIEEREGRSMNVR
jgi:hypothetical protein